MVCSTPKILRYKIPFVLIKNGHVQIKPIPKGIILRNIIPIRIDNKKNTWNHLWEIARTEALKAFQGPIFLSATSCRARKDPMAKYIPGITSSTKPSETPMEGIKAIAFMERAILVAASSTTPIRPTIRMKKVKARNCSDCGTTNRVTV